MQAQMASTPGSPPSGSSESSRYGNDGTFGSQLSFSQKDIKISVVVPFFGRTEDATVILQSMGQVALHLGDESTIELIVVNDGKPETQTDLRNRLSSGAPKFTVRLIQLSRNFGQHAAILAGLFQSQGHYVIRCNSDNHALLAYIPEIVRVLQSGEYDRCIPVHKTNGQVSSAAARFFERKMIGIEIPSGTSPLRGYSRTFVDALQRVASSQNYLLELEDWIGFRTKYLDINPHNNRTASTYGLRRRLDLLTISFSMRPRKIFGLLLGCVAFGITFVAIVSFTLLLLGARGVIGGNGFVSLALLNLFTSLLLIGVVAVIGLVAASLMSESQRRPTYVIQSDEELNR